MNASVSGRRLKIAIGIATAGRRTILSHTLDLIARQTRAPDVVVVCPVALDDVDAELFHHLPMNGRIEIGARGLTNQRNKILSATDAADVIVFFDDDFFPQLNYIEEVEKLFLENESIVAATGRPVPDGINGPGIEADAALSLVFAGKSIPEGRTVAATYGTYGCNMAFRMAPIRQYGIVFDSNLPLYGWQEDIDFSRQLSRFGRIVESNVLCGVHLGAKGGRTSGIRFGYSQIANPVYLVRKGTLSVSFAVPLAWRNVLANLGKSFRPEPWIDRRGRLKGNLLAVWDLVRGRISPQRVLDLS